MRENPGSGAAAAAVVVEADKEEANPDNGARVFTSRPMSSEAKQWSSFCRRVKVGRGEGGNEARYVVRACATLMR